MKIDGGIGLDLNTAGEQAKEAEDFGYDLDEEGQPLSDDAEDAATSRGRERSEEDSSSDGDSGNGGGAVAASRREEAGSAA